MINVQCAKAPNNEIVIYEYGCRLDKEAVQAVDEQITKARRLYNNIVEKMREVVEGAQAHVLEKAGPDAKLLHQEIENLSAEFALAKADDNEEVMASIAQIRRGKWHALGELLKGTRKQERKTVQEQYLNKIGRSLNCDTYQLRCAAVKDGLGWGTANAVLDAALVAFKKSFALGRAPRFAKGELKDIDCLTLQFTTPGGIGANSILEGKQSDFVLTPPASGAGRRHYGEFRFRLGSAKSNSYATGQFQFHRPLPENCSVGLVRLKRLRIGKDYRYGIQLMIKLQAPLEESLGGRKPLVAIHFGWSADLEGRRVAGLSETGDPGESKIIQLPANIETQLDRAAEIQGCRDNARDELIPRLKSEIHIPEAAGPDLAELWASIKKSPAQYISCNRIHYLIRRMAEANLLIPSWLEEWRKIDRMQWQGHTHIAKRARNARKDFYRRFALNLATTYSTIAIEPLNLKEAAQKVDQISGKKNPLGRKARSGRVVAAIYELDSAIRWAAAKNACAVLDVTGKTVTHCAYCEGSIIQDEEEIQVLHCVDCGAEIDRKKNGSAVAWQAASRNIEETVADYWQGVLAKRQGKAAETAEKKRKLADGRAKAREKRLSAEEDPAE